MKKFFLPFTLIMHKLTLVTLFFAISFYANSQSGFTPAIIVGNNGDSLTGEINDRDWRKTPFEIEFKSSSGELKIVNASSIKSFYIIKKNERYESYTVDVDMNPKDYNQVMAARISNPLSAKKTIFLLQLLRHDLLSLYSYIDNNKSHFYYSVSGSNPAELIDRYLLVEGESEQLQHNDTYKKQLDSIMIACPSLVAKTGNLSYTENQIKKIVTEYIQCIRPGSQLETNVNNRIPVHVGVVAGLLLNSFHATGKNDLNKGPYSNSASPVLGLMIDVGLPRKNNRWHLVNEFVFKNYKTTSSYFTHTILYDWTTDIEVSLSYLQLNTLIRYEFNTNSSVKPYLNIGAGNGFLIAQGKNTMHLAYTDGREKTTTAFEDPDKYEVSWVGGFGINWRNLQLEARYLYGNGFSPYTGMKIKVSSPGIMIGYRF